MSTATVYVVEDEQEIRGVLERLFDSEGFPVQSFANADAFLASYDPEMTGCIVTDIRMPGISGVVLQENLEGRKCRLPLIFLTGQADVELAVRCMRRGAFDFLEKPYDEQRLLDTVRRALDEEQRRRKRDEEVRTILERIGSLTPRERDVLQEMIQGHANKVIAYDLGISEKTVEVHRARVMRKMMADSLAELVRLVLSAKPQWMGLEPV